MEQIVYRTIDDASRRIRIVVTDYTEELNAELEKDEIGVNLLGIEENFEDALTTARVYKRAYEELFYQGYEVEISIKNQRR